MYDYNMHEYAWNRSCINLCMDLSMDRSIYLCMDLFMDPCMDSYMDLCMDLWMGLCINRINAVFDLHLCMAFIGVVYQRSSQYCAEEDHKYGTLSSWMMMVSSGSKRKRKVEILGRRYFLQELDGESFSINGGIATASWLDGENRWYCDWMMMMMAAHCRVVPADSSPFLKPQVGKKDTIEGCEQSREVNAWQG